MLSRRPVSVTPGGGGHAVAVVTQRAGLRVSAAVSLHLPLPDTVRGRVWTSRPLPLNGGCGLGTRKVTSVTEPGSAPRLSPRPSANP